MVSKILVNAKLVSFDAITPFSKKRCRSGGVMFASTGKDCTGVLLMVHVIIRIASLRRASMTCVWMLLIQTGQQYSATEYVRAKAVVLRTLASAPQLLPAILCNMLLLVSVFAAVLVRCCLYVSG
ncbi:unnamed protein product [Callosobruchus maculatus]|uniref:Uncharacterized protein n=1 Tax=Callosobruchus maculatus TaxID=64391 RepID=A0A653DNG2_CALMS|nr:unnamed protein product [Callosobruchus maculatus]